MSGSLKERAPETVVAFGYLLARPTLADAVPFARRFGADPRIREIRYQPVYQPLGEPFTPGWHEGHPL